MRYGNAYPGKFDACADMWNYVSTVKLSRDGTALSPAGEASNITSQYCWNTFRTIAVAELLSASDEEFDAKWEEVIAQFTKESGYAATVEEMTPQFERTIGKYVRRPTSAGRRRHRSLPAPQLFTACCQAVAGT